MKRRAALLVLLVVALGAGALTHVPKPSATTAPPMARPRAADRTSLDGVCRTFHMSGSWWRYEWCHQEHVRQYSVDPVTGAEASVNIIGRFFGATDGEASPTRARPFLTHVFLNGDMCHGGSRQSPVARNRSAEVRFSCCSFRPTETYIESISEPLLCEYLVSVCTPLACVTKLQAPDESSDDTKRLRATVKAMFYHAYNNYMEHAFPLDNLRPISCKGDTFELGKIPMLTLIDTLDTLVVFGDFDEFRRAVGLVLAGASFDLNTEVSVFETTIRVLGGLLSAHMFAVDASLGIYPDGAYTDGLLRLAVDLADRLLPAFVTKTGIPYGTVNLRYGVPEGETTVASTAGAGSLTMEFTMLSVLTGNPVYAIASRKAVRALYERKSSVGLLGKHIDVDSGDWTETISGPGSNSDSFYEYLLKMYVLFGDDESLAMFQHVYSNVMEHNKHGDWYGDVSMWDGCTGGAAIVFDNLVAFWPGMQTLLGDFETSAKSLNAYYQVWHKYGFLPEQFDVGRWRPKKASSNRYPLRPELIESTFYMHAATRDDTWRKAGAAFVASIERFSKTTCGYASIADVESRAQEDDMPSFFLSETCKYLYLLFDDTNLLRQGNYVFTTEAHPFPVLSSAQVAAIWTRGSDPSLQPAPRQALTCPRLPFYAPVSFNTSYQDAFVKMKPRCDAPRRSGAKASKKTPAKVTAPRVLHGGDALGNFLIDQLVGGFRARSDRFPGDALKVTNLGDPKIVVEFHSSDPAPLADFRIHNFETDVTTRCRLLVYDADDQLLDTITCSGALFGPTKTEGASVLVEKRPLELASPLRACAAMEAVSIGAIALVQRGDCYFDDKARRGMDAGASAVIIVNNDAAEDLMIMARSSSLDAALDETPISVPIVMVAPTAEARLRRPNTRISLEHHSVPLDDDDFPYVVGSRYDLKVVGPHGWGLHLALKTSDATGVSAWTIALVDATAPEEDDSDDVDASTSEETTTQAFARVLQQLKGLGFSDEALHLLENEDDADLRLEALLNGLRDVGLDEMADKVALKTSDAKLATTSKDDPLTPADAKRSQSMDREADSASSDMCTDADAPTNVPGR
ncbi:hypothetical protein SPRG_01028 [Saprolegnia parasitica CBS 223.65]|uniref:alpha-1,2-Mannosidase n=1 Tax=Saprolegnia parasitica (strain CBS 223.65) TaxID=695850 RepID=A0A067D8I0_SAPPC|nr:hypothetical protein SPRG_01028 [Saprolegnia parasitica CBS 223.65]KDO34966.1 hypothetical protein SPRG_01028 [Saprolegnia parasitica CBS 223.65]|eukprot:XP_012194620.1 hypothetical protein SPRG_01028 [Saprolegnia parasitica CBS 223.65]